MFKEQFARPVPMACSACGTTGIHPRIAANNQSRTEIIREAKWVCPRCGNFFHSAIVGREARNPSAS